VVQASNAIQEKGLKIWVFPEGTRHREHGFKQFKKGAFNIAVHAQIPIIPLVISDYSPFYSKEKKFFRWPGHVIVQVLKPVSTQGVSKCQKVTRFDANELEFCSNPISIKLNLSFT
jgi:lysophosphatidate acyltransferase